MKKKGKQPAQDQSAICKHCETEIDPRRVELFRLEGRKCDECVSCLTQIEQRSKQHSGSRAIQRELTSEVVVVHSAQAWKKS